MTRLHKGMVVRTSYNTGPYRIVDIEEFACTCPSFTDAVTLAKNAPPSRPHYHLTCRKVGEKTGFYYLNGYDENLCSVWNNDYLIVCSEETTILTLISTL